MDREQSGRRDFAADVLPHLDAAFNLARWLMRDAAAAEDVVQDAMLRALRFHHGFRGGNARAWVLQIVRSRAYEALRQRGMFSELSLQDNDGLQACETLADPSPDPEASLAASLDRIALDAALEALPVELRECIVLRELEGLSYKEIALVAGIPAGTVMSRLWRARQALVEMAKRRGA